MSALLSMYLKKETIETILKVLNKKSEKGIELTISTSDDLKQYGQNVTGWVSQTKEQRNEKKERFYVGNGKVFWTDGKISIAEKPVPVDCSQETAAPGFSNIPPPNDDLPF